MHGGRKGECRPAVPSPGGRSVIKDTLDPTARSGDAFQFCKSPNRSLFPRAILLAD